MSMRMSDTMRPSTVAHGLLLAAVFILLHVFYSSVYMCIQQVDDVHLEFVQQTPKFLTPEPSNRTDKLKQAAPIFSKLATGSLNQTNKTKVYKRTSDIKESTVVKNGTPLHGPFQGLTYIEAVRKAANNNSVLLLALVDGGFMEMALNFFITCIASHQIKNYLLIATDNDTCAQLLARNINCYVYRVDGDSQDASVYHSKAFLRKMNIRTDMILDVLRDGFSVLHTDIDVYFFSNPFDHISCKIGSCDIAALQDTFAYNAGFLYINPTAASKAVYKQMQDIAKASPKIDDQKQLNTAIKQQAKRNKKFHAFKLDKKVYQCGKYYFEDAKRFFAGEHPPCNTCVVVHNNWIVSMEAKVYRAKEMHQWMYDGDEYYSSTNRKYIMYDNPLTGLSSDLKTKEVQALVNALAIGKILNRIVILPKFHCSGLPCPLNSVLRLSAFDASFANLYREHSYLSHPLVPTEVVNNRVGSFLITSKYILEKAPEVLNNSAIVTFEPYDLERGMSETEILLNFKDLSASIIHFSAMYDAFDQFSDNETQAAFSASVKDGIKYAGYRQH